MIEAKLHHRLTPSRSLIQRICPKPFDTDVPFSLAALLLGSLESFDSLEDVPNRLMSRNPNHTDEEKTEVHLRVLFIRNSGDH